MEALAARWRTERTERQARRHLEPRDFEALRAAGFWAAVAPQASGGTWQGAETSARPICRALRHLAAGDPSVALVSSMHPTVIAFWLANPDPTQRAWEAQRRAVFASAAAGEEWGTITSEPGSGGDISRTSSRAKPAEGPRSLPGRPYTVTGDKHFGSGMGVTDWMMTTAIPEGESEPAIFVLDVRSHSLDGSHGLQLIAEWDGMGMAATQSHAMRLENAPAVRFGLDLPLDRVQVEWSRAEQEYWLSLQALEGALRALEAGEAHRCGPRRPASKAGGRRAGGGDPAAAGSGPRWWHVLPWLALRALVRRRARSRLLAASLGPGLRSAVRDILAGQPCLG